jgi:hypothetical protein
MTDVEDRAAGDGDASAQRPYVDEPAELDLATPPSLGTQTFVSGRYGWRRRSAQPWPPGPSSPSAHPATDGEAARRVDAAPPLASLLVRRERLRLDVDRRYPQLTASGMGRAAMSERYHWIASLTEVGPDHWTGPIWFRDGSATLFPYTAVDVVATRSAYPNQRSVTATFTGGGVSPLTRTYDWESASYHPVEFEYDSTSDANPVTSIGTCDHPNRPSSMPCEQLSIERVFHRVGFSVSLAAGGMVPLTGAGSDSRWSDTEMHDAMQTYWSRFSGAPRWALWTFWAALHERGASLGGIMFDDIGSNHRQGTALFTEAFIKNAPAGDAAPEAWVRRMRFWTAVHEMGHAFNLAHSWQKSLGTPWVPLPDEPEARSFMNYPYNVSGGESAFFADFDFRFSDAELLFMRHAPARFIQMGNADWFDHHGFEQDDDGPASTVASALRLEVRANRERARFEFLEPVTLELKLTNTGSAPVLVPTTVLDPQGVVAIIKRSGHPARQWHPYARYCRDSSPVVLAPGESRYEALPIFAGLNGWDLAEPGRYEISVGVEIDGALVTSDPMRLRIARPGSRDEEAVADDFFAEDVGRTLAFGGTAVLEAANETLRETVDRLPDSRAARHASAALAAPLVSAHKLLVIPDTRQPIATVAQAGGSLSERPARVDDAVEMLRGLTDTDAAETLGHIAYRRRMEAATGALARGGETEPAAQLQRSLLDVLTERDVLPSVLASVSEKAAAYESESARS